jgi:Flp pilus assembly protein TadG
MKRDHLRSDEDGAAIVELAVVTPFLALLISCTLQIGVSFYHQLAVTDIARAVARASVNANNAESLCLTARAAFQKSLTAAGLDYSHFTLTLTTTRENVDNMYWDLKHLKAQIQLTEESDGVSKFYLFEPQAVSTFPLQQNGPELSDECASVWVL